MVPSVPIRAGQTEYVHRKIALQFLVSNANTAAGFLLSLVLSRLLSPGEIGLFSMGAVLVGFSHVFRDFGVVAFIKRQRDLRPDTLRSASGLLYATSWTMAAVLYFGASHWARFLGHPEVRHVVEVLSIGYLFIPVGAVPQALLQREFDVRRMAFITGGSVTAYVATSIGLALAGFGHMTMPWANVVNILVTGLLSHTLRPAGTNVFPAFGGWSKVASFGTGALVTNALKSFDTALPDILLGKLGSASLVGLFSRATSTASIITMVVTPTVEFFSLPYLAKKFHEQTDISAEVIYGTSLVTGLVWPALAFMAAMAGPVVMLLYGVKWLPSAAAIPWLCVMVGTSTLLALAIPALLGLGRPYLAAWPAACALVLKVALAIAWHDGTLLTFARAIATAELLAAPLQLGIVGRALGVHPLSFLRALLPSLAVAIGVGAVAFVTGHLLANMLPNLLLVGAAVLAGSGTWLALGHWLGLPAMSELLALWRSRRANSA